MNAIGILVDRIFLTTDNKVKRHWSVNEDTSLTWRKRAEIIFSIERHNVVPEPKRPRALYSCEGQKFYPHKQPVTLDDFVFLHDSYKYYHLASGLTFTATQINHQIFRSKEFWPLRHATGERMNPAMFIRKHNRINKSAALFAARGVLSNAA